MAVPGASMFVTKNGCCHRGTGQQSLTPYFLARTSSIPSLSASSKWVPADIIQKFGPLAHKVNVDGYTRQAHIDHLKPCLDNTAAARTPGTLQWCI